MGLPRWMSVLLLRGRELHDLDFIFCERRTDMYLFFSPAIAALITIAVIQIRDQFRFTNSK
jgi:hypothetical protein